MGQLSVAVGCGSWIWQFDVLLVSAAVACDGRVPRVVAVVCGAGEEVEAFGRCLGEAGRERQGLFQHGTRRGGGPCVGCGSRTERRAGALERW
jgi:hypothetical protein